MGVSAKHGFERGWILQTGRWTEARLYSEPVWRGRWRPDKKGQALRVRRLRRIAPAAKIAFHRERPDARPAARRVRGSGGQSLRWIAISQQHYSAIADHQIRL